MKLEVGMYVRTKDGIIAKADYVDDDTIFFDKDLYRTYDDSINFLEKNNLERIVKASYNIIDILEVGDYVNGEIVLKDEIGGLYLDAFDADGNYYKCRIQNIKTIVTKEQFEQMAYKVGD